ncbi:hypothetical protein BLNAU_1492 [Blattamonas nauphoetae]|uniref:Uncharacterized protein n=1 Tax=Blattamonas nauphoetae TaxID=2049346 RepID=A0ABQ9YI87_9EUKA|nr:hypothetical protein BLNAU_1492 [Blattamonas nauphoetae]
MKVTFGSPCITLDLRRKSDLRLYLTGRVPPRQRPSLRFYSFSSISSLLSISAFFFHFNKAINQTPVCIYPAYRITSLQLSLTSTDQTKVHHIATTALRFPSLSSQLSLLFFPLHLSKFYQPNKHFTIRADPFNPNSNQPPFPNRLFILFNNRHTTVHARSILRQSTALSQLATCHFANFNSLLNNALFLQFQGFHKINALPHPHFITIANLFINALQTSLQSLWPPTLAGVHHIEVWLRFAKLSGRGRVVFAEHPQGEHVCFFSLHLLFPILFPPQTVHSILSLSHGSFPFSFKYTFPIVGDISVNGVLSSFRKGCEHSDTEHDFTTHSTFSLPSSEAYPSIPTLSQTSSFPSPNTLKYPVFVPKLNLQHIFASSHLPAIPPPLLPTPPPLHPLSSIFTIRPLQTSTHNPTSSQSKSIPTLSPQSPPNLNPPQHPTEHPLQTSLSLNSPHFPQIHLPQIDRLLLSTNQPPLPSSNSSSPSSLPDSIPQIQLSPALRASSVQYVLSLFVPKGLSFLQINTSLP